MASHDQHGAGTLRGTALRYVALAGTWGSSFLLIKVALRGLAPGQVVFARVVVGAAVLALMMTLGRRRWPREPRLWLHLAVLGLLYCAVPFTLFAYAGETLPSGLSAILNATVPLMTVLATAVVVPAEKLGVRKALGVLVGGAGVAIVVGIWRLATPDVAASLPSILACLGATACYGTGFAYMRRFVIGRHPYDAVTIAAGQVLTAAVVMCVALPFFGGPAPALDPVVVAGVALLGAFGTGLAYAWNTRIVVAWGPVAASTVTYLTPLVGVALGIAVLGERLSWNEPVGGVVVLLGVLITQGSVRLGRRRP